ncbi:MAG: NDP-sugar synthase [Actinobacteria bacterium]|nr:NDP-sugar synthase [Actinomycetota bacterium]
MKAVILAGGKGTRVRPLTYKTPKPMLPLVNRPFIYNFILWLKSHGLVDIILSTCYLPDVFIDYLGDGSSLGVSLTYVTETTPLGTCGAVKNVERYIGSDSFMVFNGDVLTSLNLTELIEYHKAKKADITIALTPVEDPTSYGLVPIDEDGRVIEFLEKPSPEEIVTNLINAGTYVIESRIMKLVPSGKPYSFERELFPEALRRGYRVYGFVSNSYWLDVGTPEKYLAAHYDVLDKKIDFKIPYEEVFQNIYIGRGAQYSKDNFVSGPIVIGEGTVIESKAKIFPLTVIGSNCRISSGTHISGGLIFDNTEIGRNCHIAQAIISKNVKIGESVRVEGFSVVGDDCVIERDNILRHGIKLNVGSRILPGQIFF